MVRAVLGMVGICVLSACAQTGDQIREPVDLGNFSLGHNVVVAPKVQTSSTLGREVPKEELTASLKSAIAAQLDRYDGEKRYHLGVSVEGYVLARPGVPVVAAPKSAMIVQVTVWDDLKAQKLNVPPDQITVLEDIDGESIIGSGWTQTAQTQLDGLSQNAAKAIETFLLTKNQEYGWFESEEEAARRAAATAAAKAAEEAEAENDAPAARITPVPETSGA